MEKITFCFRKRTEDQLEDASKIEPEKEKMNGSRWMEKITFCFGSEKNKRSVAREREKKSSKMTWSVHFSGRRRA